MRTRSASDGVTPGQSRWKVSGKLLSGALFASDEGWQVIHKAKVTIKAPEDAKTGRKYCGIGYDLWRYSVEVEFDAASPDEAFYKGHEWMERIAARLSFLASAPVEIEEYGTVTDCIDREPGRTYTAVITPAALSTIQLEGPKISDEYFEEVAKFLAYERLSENAKVNARVTRSLQWLQHSYFARTDLDQFAYMFLALDAIAPLLPGEGRKHWHCRHCNAPTLQCPHCGESTESTESTSAKMRAVACDGIGLTPARWKEISDYRHHALHGGVELGMSEQAKARSLLHDMDRVVTSSLKACLAMTDACPPFNLRNRPNFEAAKLQLSYSLPDTQASVPDGDAPTAKPS